MTPEKLREIAEAMLSAPKVNLQHPSEKGCRVVGFKLPAEVAGLSDGLFALEKLLSDKSASEAALEEALDWEEQCCVLERRLEASEARIEAAMDVLLTASGMNTAVYPSEVMALLRADDPPARAVPASEARVLELVGALEEAVSWIEDLPRKNASHAMRDDKLAGLRSALNSPPAGGGGDHE